MKLNRKTKAELIGMIIEKDISLERKNAEIQGLISQRTSLIQDNNLEKLTITEMNKDKALATLDKVAMIKSFLTLLEPFKEDTMTHHEKRYLANKISNTLEKQVVKELKKIDLNVNNELMF